MAKGDIVWFDEAATFDYFASWATSDDIKCAVLDNTTAPTAGDTTPALADYTEVTAAGTYTAGGTSLGTWDAVNTMMTMLVLLAGVAGSNSILI